MVITTNSTQLSPDRSSGGSGRVAVLLTGYGGVQNYKDFVEYNRRASTYIAAKFAPIPQWLYPFAARVLTLRDLYKWGYKHDHFTSPQNDIFEQQRAGIEQHLQIRWGDQVQVFKAFFFCEPFLDQVLAQIKQQGFDNLLIYPLMVVNSAFTSSIAVEQVNQVMGQMIDSQQFQFKDLRYIPSFACEPAYADLMAHQVEEKIAQDLLTEFFPSQIGIVLEVHGGPKKSKGLITGVEEGQALYDRIQSRLIHQYPLISVGWVNHKTPLVEWSKPNLEEAAKNLIDLGAKVIIFKPVGWATDNYETILEIEEAINTLKRHHSTVHYVQMACANDHPEFLKMAADWAQPDIEALVKAEG